MSNYYKHALQRANLYEVGSFMLAATRPSPPPPDYEQAIDDAWDALSAQLDQHIADRHIRDNVRSLILIYTNTIGDAYINLGLKAGARLLQELLHTP